MLCLEPSGGQAAVTPRSNSAAESAPAASLGLSPAAMEAKAREALSRLLAMGVGTKAAAGIVAELTGLAARRAYALALEAKEGPKQEP